MGYYNNIIIFAIIMFIITTMSIVNNPFIVGGYLSPHYFCDRETETEQLIRNITNGRNVVIISVRRMERQGSSAIVFIRIR